MRSKYFGYVYERYAVALSHIWKEENVKLLMGFCFHGDFDGRTVVEVHKADRHNKNDGDEVLISFSKMLL